MISYNWGSQSTVLQLRDRLKAAGFNIWIDVEHTSAYIQCSSLTSEFPRISQRKLITSFSHSFLTSLDLTYSRSCFAGDLCRTQLVKQKQKQQQYQQLQQLLQQDLLEFRDRGQSLVFETKGVTSDCSKKRNERLSFAESVSILQTFASANHYTGFC